MPFAGYEDFDDCVSKNQDQTDPARYCGAIEARVKAAEAALADMPIVPEGDPDDPEQEALDETAPYGDEQFHALLVIEGIWTGDGRYMDDASLSWRDLPLPLMALDRTTDGHDDAILVGTFTRLERLGPEIHGWGRFVQSDDPQVQRLQRLIENGELRGISVDLDSLAYDVVLPAESVAMASPEPDADGNVRVSGEDSGRMIITAGRIMGATACPFPAFAEAFIESRALLAAALAQPTHFASLDDVDLAPPQGAREEAQRGLDWRTEHGRGGTAVGIARARDIANGRNLSPDTIGRMLSYFARHEVDKQGTGWSPGEDGFPSNGRIAWALWGGDDGWAFARRAQESIDARRREGSIVAAGPLTGFLERWAEVGNVDLTAPKPVQDEARQGLKWAAQRGRGGSPMARARARDMAAGRRLTPDAIGRALRYFARHEPDRGATGWHPGEPGYPSDARVAWALYGGDAGLEWLRKAAAEIEHSATGRALVAAAAPIQAPICPPSDWFTAPTLDGPTPITVTDDGRVFGHAATWGTCHIGFNGRCVTPPRSSSDYGWFRTGEVLCENGDRVAVGQITVDTGHAPHHLAARPAAAHYDHTGSVVADVAAGEDAWGIWVAGSLRPGITGEQLRAFMASDVSGDWRLVAGNMEMVGLLAVNVPGFPKRRVTMYEANGLVASITAAFTPEPLERPATAAVVDRIAASIGRSKQDRIAALSARVKGGK